MKRFHLYIFLLLSLLFCINVYFSKKLFFSSFSPLSCVRTTGKKNPRLYVYGLSDWT